MRERGSVAAVSVTHAGFIVGSDHRASHVPEFDYDLLNGESFEAFNDEAVFLEGPRFYLRFDPSQEFIREFYQVKAGQTPAAENLKLYVTLQSLSDGAIRRVQALIDTAPVNLADCVPVAPAFFQGQRHGAVITLRSFAM